MGIMQSFCDAIFQEIKAYETKKTGSKKKLHPIRQQDITTLTNLLEKARKENPTNIGLLHQQIMDFLQGMKTTQWGFIVLSSDLRNRLLEVLTKPQFMLTQMMLIELQENQAHQSVIIHTKLTQHDQEITLLNQELDERDALSETLKKECGKLTLENIQLKASLKACAGENTTERLNQLHTEIVEQKMTIAELNDALEKEKRENQRLREENRDLKNPTKEVAPLTSDHSIESGFYDSPLSDKCHSQTKAMENNSAHRIENTVELKTFGS